jgi:hypothetical protein
MSLSLDYKAEQIMIEWNPVDVLTCLETEPAVETDETSYRYTFTRNGLLVALEIWPYASDVWIAMRPADQPGLILDLQMKGCREIRYLRDKTDEALHFVSFDGHSSYPANIPDGWQLRVNPHIAVTLPYYAGPVASRSAG